MVNVRSLENRLNSSRSSDGYTALALSTDTGFSISFSGSGKTLISLVIKPNFKCLNTT